MNESENEDYYCPCREADPDHFITNKDVDWLIEHPEEYTFTQEDYLRVYNCIHCNDCGTADKRFILKEKFLKDGGKIEGLEDTIKTILTLGTPFKDNNSRVKIPNGIPTRSDTLLYLGCFTTVKTPEYAQNIIKYLIKKGILFTLLEKEICCGYPILCNGEIGAYKELVMRNQALFKEKGYKRIITACPSCYMVFKKEYNSLDLKIKYFTEYLTPAEQQKKGTLIIQHACPLRNGEIPGIEKNLEDIFTKSGYKVLSDIPNTCCGGGVGHQLRTDVIESIAMKRMEDFKLENGIFSEFPAKNNYITTYCPDAFWILKVYGRRKRIPFCLKDPCALLT